MEKDTYWCIQMSDSKQGRKLPPNTRRLAGMGVELAGTLAVFCLLGYWIDSKFDTSPLWMVIFSFLGIIGGLYNMIRQSVHEMFSNKGGNEPEDKERKRSKQDVDS